LPYHYRGNGKILKWRNHIFRLCHRDKTSNNTPIPTYTTYVYHHIPHVQVVVVVNTKNWYREETDMWAEFGRRAPFGRRFSSRHSVEASAVGSTSSFGRRTVPRVKAEAFGSAWWRGLDIKKEASWWWIRDGHDGMVLIFGNKML
jgi:hypothetical protein